MKRSVDLPKKISGKSRFKGGLYENPLKLAVGLLMGVLIIAELAATVALFLSRARNVGVVDEDAYISFRYAQNLLAGEGLVFNPDGQRVEGITNLLWTLFVAAGSWVGDAGLPEVSVTLGLVFGVLTLLLAWAWGFEELFGSGGSLPVAAAGALAAPLLLAIAPGFAFYAASGLEVVFFGFLVLAGLYFLRGGGKLWCAALGSLLLGAAAMTRPEGAMVLAFAAAGYSFWPGNDRWRRLLAASVPGGVALIGVTLWRLYYYGSPIPNTAFAKAGGFEVMQRWGLPYIAETAAENWFHVAWLFVLAGAISHRRFLKRNLAVVCLVPAWAAYVVYAGGDYMPFGRFVLPILPVVYVLGAVGVGLVYRAMVSIPGRFQFLTGTASVALPVVVILLMFALQVPEQVSEEEERRDYLRAMTDQRRAAANWFDENAPGALVARNGVGAFGYYSDIRLLDMLGLNSSYIAHHGETYPGMTPGHQKSDGEYIVSREPEYVMVGRVKPPFTFASEKALYDNLEFRQEYERFMVDPDGGRGLYVWKRQEG